MDIREWLQHIADREPPEEQQKLAFPDSMQQPTVGAAKHSRSRVAKRKRPSNDVRDEAALPTGHAKRRHRVTHSSSSECVQRTPDSDATSLSETTSQSSELHGVDRQRAPAECFKRRPRHKTRADCYESKPKRKKAHKSRDAKKPKSKHQKSRRRGDGDRTTDLVQSFQLKNGAKNNRLTLQPDARVGIFNHGKASVPVIASGQGLPDLVFNEMRFLSRPKDQEIQVPVNDASNQRKKSRKELRDEEISTYFRKVYADRQPGQNADAQLLNNGASVQPASQTKARHSGLSELSDVHSLPKEQRRHTNPAKDSTRVSRKMRHARSNSKSCYTWSESIQKAKPTSCRSDRSRPSRSSHTPSRVRHDHDEGLVKEVGNPAPVRPLRVARSSPRTRSTHPSLPENNPPHFESALRSVTSAPLPQQEIAGSPVAPVTKSGRATVHHTSDILALRGNRAGSSPSLSLPCASEGNADEENIDPLSTPTSKLLREALYAVAHPQKYVFSSAAHQSPVVDTRWTTADQPRSRAMPQIGKWDNSEYSSRHYRPVQESSSCNPIPCRGFTRVGVGNGPRTAQQLYPAPAGPIPLFTGTQFSPAVRFVDRYTEQFAEHAEVVNNTQATYRSREANFDECFETRETEGAPHGCAPAPPDYLNDQDERDWQYPLQLGHVEDDTMEFVYQEVPMGGDAAEDEALERMSGFWRPNVLY
ncbi:hypothetical protein CERZMDRAFT_80321 [Cercospora zeae-maydis SCOH1-5]|uniref:Uncharacterized protein n=1 Tax=Cercospora zeae-maydis SCOH1-5 TaxID=717836 RepID=A0A6A6FVT4_9PEZI|nr:hypothetical protein CERZMDRAFT_80321 [Cercospora zeae-maydis SCOH1-5]